MPRYYFNTADGGRDQDTDGTELPDTQAAHREAVRFAGSVLDSEPGLLSDGGQFRVEVTNDRGGLLFTVVTRTVEAPAANPAGEAR